MIMVNYLSSNQLVNDLTMFFPKNANGGKAAVLTGNEIPMFLLGLAGLFLVCGLIAWLQIRKTKSTF